MKDLNKKYVKKYYNLKEYINYCEECGINPNERKSKIQYGKMLLGFLKYEIGINE